MIYLGYFIFFFATLRLGVALSNVLFNVHLPKKFTLQQNPLISILIPARNEENKIGNLLCDIQKLTYPNWEVWVYDDMSTDNTAEIVNEFASADNRIHLVQGYGLPQGWLGKNHACYQLTNHSKGNYLLFIDADVRVKGDLLEKSIYQLQKQKLGLLSIFPKQILDHFGAWISVPFMNWILLSLLPLVLVRICSWTSFSAANGQFMMFDARIYRKMQPHLKLKNQKVEDIEICKYYKKNKIKVSTLLGDSLVECKMYTSLYEAILGFSKNVFAFFGNSVIVTFLFMLVTSLSPFFIFFAFGIRIAIIYLLILVMIKLCTSLASKQSIILNLTYMPFQQIFLVALTIYAWKKRLKKTLSWKGRNI